MCKFRNIALFRSANDDVVTSIVIIIIMIIIIIIRIQMMRIIIRRTIQNNYTLLYKNVTQFLDVFFKLILQNS